MRFAANLGFLFTELPFVDRFAAAREAGFEAVEFPWPGDAVAAGMAAARDGPRVAQLNMDGGDLAAGERGYASHPARTERWRAAFLEALELSERLGCPAIHVLAGNRLPELSAAAQLACLRENIAWAVPLVRPRGRTLLLEVLNRYDTPAYLFTDHRSALAFIASVGEPMLRLQFDTYHLARAGEDVARLFARLAGAVGHVQVADAPDRHEPGSGTIDFVRFFDAVAAAGYRGAIGLEYLPSTTTEASLRWLPRGARGWSDAPFRYARC